MKRVFALILIAFFGLAACSAKSVATHKSGALPSGPTIIKVGAQPCASAPGAGSMWVTNYGSSTISQIDAATNRVTATFPVGLQPCGVAVVAGRVWVALVGDHNVVEIDPVSGRVLHTIPISGPVFDLQAGFGSIWVNDHGSHVLRIDPQSAKVIATIPVGNGATLYGLAVTPEGVWAADTTGKMISRINPTTDRVIAMIADPSGSPYTFAYTTGALWVSSFPGATLRIDPMHNQVVTSVAFGSTGSAGGDPDALDGRAFVPDGDDGTLAAIDPATNMISGKIRLGPGYLVAQAGFGSMWDCNFQGDTVARVDPSQLH